MTEETNTSVEEAVLAKKTDSLRIKQAVFLDVYFEEIQKGVKYLEAAKIAKDAAGYHPNTSIFAIAETLKDEIVKRCQHKVALGLPSTVLKVEGVLEDPTQPGSKVILDAAQMLMDRAGLSKKEQLEVEVKAPDGVILIPAKIKDK